VAYRVVVRKREPRTEIEMMSFIYIYGNGYDEKIHMLALV